ncbi:hypothetical protein [Tropicimonas isoalkanivorans]|uniref:Uncharacterized protein n=1 Tax=Tropicimonas isoalkanivorans TaxID=441112 RepID=A0A1I1MHH2_9RHOB|nr:hypothetical protein [Tropicimonas isoalkanivorans]SFC84891.1 hypothetical protein SAMN04488094_11034 [Tropicimonas isoalkanivorans]
MGRLYRNLHFLMISTLLMMAVGVALTRAPDVVGAQTTVSDGGLASAGIGHSRAAAGL